MALFTVILGNKAEKQCAALEEKIKVRVIELFKTLEEEPVPYKKYDLKKLQGRDETYHIRFSRFRVTYQVYWAEKSIEVAKVERRSDNTYD